MSNSHIDFVRDVAIGSASAVSAVPFIQPLVFFKNRVQTGNSSPIGSVRAVYRGGAGFAASFAPTTALQTAAKGIFAHNIDPIPAAAAAGVVSAAVVCPAEMVMIQQQSNKKSFWQTVHHIQHVCGVRGFYRGFMPTAVREGVFSAAYLGGADAVKERLIDTGASEFGGQLGAGIAIGSGAAIISHPFDTMKTQMQKELFSPILPLFNKTAFAGVGWRISMTVVAITVMPFVKSKLQETSTWQ